MRFYTNRNKKPFHIPGIQTQLLYSTLPINYMWLHSFQHKPSPSLLQITLSCVHLCLVFYFHAWTSASPLGEQGKEFQCDEHSVSPFSASCC